eukprot:m.137115 g.137115  ORF g.137115 m.137115 type:complete len:71 (+) comp11454_c0_seq2:322-534(+)
MAHNTSTNELASTAMVRTVLVRVLCAWLVLGCLFCVPTRLDVRLLPAPDSTVSLLVSPTGCTKDWHKRHV